MVWTFYALLIVVVVGAAIVSLSGLIHRHPAVHVLPDEDAGIITNVVIIPGSTSSYTLTQIQTTKYSFAVLSTPSVKINAHCLLQKYSDGSQWFTWDDSPYRYRF